MPLAPKYISDGCTMKIRQQRKMLNIVFIKIFNGCFVSWEISQDCSHGFVKATFAAFHSTVLFVHHQICVCYFLSASSLDCYKELGEMHRQYLLLVHSSYIFREACVPIKETQAFIESALWTLVVLYISSDSPLSMARLDLCLIGNGVSKSR